MTDREARTGCAYVPGRRGLRRHRIPQRIALMLILLQTLLLLRLNIITVARR